MRLMSSGGGGGGSGFITPEEVLQLGANWRRITSAVGRPDTLGEPEWGDGETESSVEGIQGALSMLTGRPEEGFFLCWCISRTSLSVDSRFCGIAAF